MTPRNAEIELGQRLPWLLVFRGLIATVLLGLTLIADARDLPGSQVAPLMYAVVIGTYASVFLLGLLLRAATPPVVVAAAYLALAVASTFGVVQATGVVDSGFTFLYLLAVLDGAIVGGRRAALAVATACSLAYGGQLLLQLYEVWPAEVFVQPSEWEYSIAAILHVAGFYLTALLAGQLAESSRRAREAAASARVDLRLAHELHAAILASLPVGVLTTDDDLVIHTANPCAARILGKPAAELLGCPVPPPLDALLRAEPKNLVNRVTVSGRVLALSVLRSRITSAEQAADGRESDAAAWASLTPRLDVVVIEDRTEVVTLESKLELNARLAAIGELAAAVAHEVRNPLAAISGSLELLAQSQGDDASRGPLCEIILREVARLNRLVEEFMLFARPAPLEREQVDLVGLARELCAVLQPGLAADASSVRVLGPEKLLASVDAHQIRQVLWNLIRNAIDASPAGEPVEVRLSETSVSGPRSVVIEVSDRGSGVAPEIREHLFEPFRTTKPEGTGLGLAIVLRIVEAHEGSIELLSAEPQGTTARVRLAG